jgi:hypothetical protein
MSEGQSRAERNKLKRLLARKEKETKSHKSETGNKEAKPQPNSPAPLAASVPIRQVKTLEAIHAKDISHNDTQEAERPSERKIARFTMLLFFVTVIYSVISYFQWNTSNKQARLMNISIEEAKTTRELENRAYMNVKQVSPIRPLLGKEVVTPQTPPLQPERPAVVKITYQNTGASPANFVKVFAALEVWDRVMPTPMPTIFSVESPSESTSGPTIETDVIRYTTTPLDKETVSAIILGKKRLYAYGVIKYEDIFQKSHQTSFCAIYHPPTQEYIVCPEGKNNQAY